jgi:hypothetical protein
LATNKPQRDILFGLLCAGALAALSTFYILQILGTGNQAVDPHVYKERKRTEAIHKQEAPVWDWFARDAAGFFTFWLVVVGLGQAVLFFQQLRFMREGLADAKEAADAARDTARATGDAVTLARQSAEIQLRAYMSIRRTTISNVGFGNVPEVEIETINYGQTPAYRVCVTHRYCLANFPLNEEISQPQKESSSTVGPGLTLLSAARGSAALTFEHMQGVQKGDLAIYVIGKITYEDAFSQKRTNNFRFFVGGKKGFPPNNSMFADLEGNYAD